MVRNLPILFLLVVLAPSVCFAHEHGTVAVHFAENMGQWEGPFIYRASVTGATAFLEKDGITWVKLQEDADQIMHDLAQLSLEERETLQLTGHAWQMKFHGADPEPVITGSEPAAFTHNYILGNDPARWRSNVPLMGTITYHDLWPGVDMIIKGTANGNLKYDLVVHPGADPSVIAFSFNGLDDVNISPEGELILPTAVGDVRELAPVAYYADDHASIHCAFVYADGLLRFDLGAHDPDREVVIDPELIAATYSGAVGPSNYGHCATYDDAGNIYSGARSFGQGYPTTLGAFQADFGGGSVDISISKLSPDGSQLIYATYVGGSGAEYPHSLVVNDQEQLCILGSTSSANYPVSGNAYQPTYGGGTDMVITVLTMDGTGVHGSTYLGGSGSDGSNGMYANYGEQFRGEIITDDLDNILVGSFSQSADFPTTPGAYQTEHGGLQDAIILSLNSTCSTLNWSTFFGGAMNDGAFGLRSVGVSVFVCGQTFSTDLPTTPGAYQEASQGGQDGFVIRLGNNGAALQASTYFGTGSADRPYFLDYDSDDNIWIYGQSVGPIPLQPAGVYGDAGGTIFLAKLDQALSQVLVSTKFGVGTSPVMTPVAFLVDHCDKVYVSGYDAAWSDLPLTGNALYSSGSFYLAAFDVDVSELVFATYYGGNHVDGGTSRFDKNGIVYQGVCSSGNSMQTTDFAHASTQSVAWDIGVFKIDFQVAGVTAAGASPVNQGCAPIEIQFSNSSTGTDWMWDFGDGSAPVSAFEPSHLYIEAGNYTITLIASDSMACNLADTINFQIDIGLGETYDASFISDQDPACAVTEVSFTNTSTGGFMNFLWDMGDGTQYTDTNVVHTYADAGTYTVQLNIVDPSGCSQPDSVAQEVQVVLDVVLVEAIAAITAPDPCGDMTVTGTNMSTGVAPEFQWHMGDGIVLEGSEISHTYAEPGEYTIQFIALDPATCNGSDTLSWEIQVQGMAEAELAFEVELEQICATGQVQTTNLSTGAALTYVWNMGDGTEYTDTEVSHLYEASGQYMIELSAIDPAGCASPMPFYVPVYVGEPLPVTAGFGVDIAFTCEGTLVTATNYSGGENLAYQWSFGDGNTSTETAGEHFYVEDGEYILELVVIDLNGCLPNDTMQQAIQVQGAPVIDATFDHALLDNCEGAQLIGETAQEGAINYTWTMGDGTELYGTYIDHQYTQEGEYEIMLVAEDPDGCGSDTTFATVQVEMPLIMAVSFDLEEVNECGQTTVNCVNTSIGNDLTYIWWTSDEFSYYGPQMQHTFTEPGDYEIRFYGMDPMDCSGPDSVSVFITVDPVEPIAAELSLNSVPGCSGTTVHASAENVSGEVSYAWTMGDGSNYTDQEVEHIYGTPGTYTIQLTVTDATGCNDPLVLEEDIVIDPPPVVAAAFEMESTPGCGTLDVTLINASEGSPAGLSWDMGNGDVLIGEAVSYTYDEPGTYTITFTVSDPESCNVSDTDATTVTVDPVPEFAAAFELVEVAECGEVEVTCTNTSEGENVNYLWSMGDGTTYATTNAEHLFSSPGTYTILLIVNDPSGCLPPDTATAEVVVPEPMEITVDMLLEQVGDCSAMQVQCSNLSGGMLFDWVWDMGDGTQYNTFDASHTYTEPGTYNVTLVVNDPTCGLQAMNEIPVTVANGIPMVTLSSPVLCSGATVTLDAGATAGTYTWSNGSNAQSITIDTPGTYSVTVEGEDGCVGTTTIVVHTGQVVEFEQNLQACPDELLTLTVPVEGVAYTWSTGGIEQTEHVRGEGSYMFFVTDTDGCQHTGVYNVEALDAEAQLYAPNAFSPNGDGINDEFTVFGHGEEAARLAIYNRWGELLYETKQSPPTWDGLYNGDIVKQDVYVYQLEYRSVCNKAMVNTTGHVTVLR